MKAFEVWKFIDENLRLRLPVMLMYVVESNGSSPGRQGFCMAVNIDSAISGSIGGGIMEFKLTELAKKKLKEESFFLTLQKQVHNKKSKNDQSGMICSGEQRILLYRIDEKDALPINNLLQHHQGTLTLSPLGIDFSKENILKENFLFTYNSNSDWIYQEKTGYKNQLYIIGSGHCSLALSRIMCMLDFYIHLYDDRNSLNTFEKNNYVQEKNIINTYNELDDIIPEGENIYVVVMTYGYRTDDIVIRTLMNKKFRYFGMMGSAKKTKKMMDDYYKEGLNKTWLKKICSPIGISIKSKTPEEIAVSIVAEIIKEKNK